MSLIGSGVRRNEEIEADVKATLKRDGRVNVGDLAVSVRDREVTLEGTVDNRLSRAIAAEMARFTPGVKRVVDNLEVDLIRTKPGPSDEDLAARANDVLQWHSDLEGSDVEAFTRTGVVELNGSVDQHWKADRAQQLVMGIRGAVDVKNNLAVVPTQEVADEALAEEITAGLRRTFLVDEDRVGVEVKDGTVTLEGRTTSWMEANTVRDVVSSTPGVREIRNLMEVEG